MLEKDRYLKKNNLTFFIKIVFFIFIFDYAFSNSLNDKQNIIDYMTNLDNFSASFIQSDFNTVEEGVVYIGQKRIKANYSYPSKITLIMDKNKAMFVNHDLKEVEYFDPRDSSAGIFFDIFQNQMVLLESKIKIEKNSITLINQKNYDGISYNISVYFEKNPNILRKIKINYDDVNLSLSFFNHNFNNKFEKKFFSMVNPYLKN